MEIEQYQLPGMPEPEEQTIDQVEQFLSAAHKYGPLVSVTIAARILGVTDTALNFYAKRGRLTKLHLMGNSPFFVLSEIEERLRNPRAPGRPKKVAA